MNALEGASQTITLITQALPAIKQLVSLVERSRRHIVGQRFSYENQSVSYMIELRDPEGKYAIVTCKQRIRFLVAEAGIVTSHIWGEGNRLSRYEIKGAERLGFRSEGSKHVLLLDVGHTPGKDTLATLSSRRHIKGGFTRPEEYFEASVEHPTKALSLQILFPKNRPPVNAYLAGVSGDGPGRLPTSVDASGRTVINWRSTRPELNRVYSLRWSW